MNLHNIVHAVHQHFVQYQIGRLFLSSMMAQ